MRNAETKVEPPELAKAKSRKQCRHSKDEQRAPITKQQAAGSKKSPV